MEPQHGPRGVTGTIARSTSCQPPSQTLLFIRRVWTRLVDITDFPSFHHSVHRGSWNLRNRVDLLRYKTPRLRIMGIFLPIPFSPHYYVQAICIFQRAVLTILYIL